ncbi:patatin-like phospholipase family protein [Flavobacterium silvaticum]|uniref:Patatin-like phospholipase family protein n=1 Tax=Flavobacterium silvaticum TaxID=1852020 RepID=A0A972JF59_9FLAO|nr:patatin-like phospholipase family protein [Flavobacterium silvaticum]NMH26891.1 patatin-like phospholipase family protein [Flavobacterium silvaticum]
MTILAIKPATDKSMYRTFRKLGALTLLLLVASVTYAQKQRPKIAITLSGGGAKGMAHVGVLKAIDSAGLKVDYVTGTSMGAVVGGLYAAGYSANEILDISKTLDWTSLLSNDLPLSTLKIREKEEFGHYIEVPLHKGKLSLKRGIIESNELWLKLAEFYFSYYEISDFSKFDKGFLCIATDVGNGKMVVLDKGDMVSAVRASMAIPSVFTPVDIDGKILIDGGLTRNFPVANAREMGADIVIGSDVSGSINAIDQIKSPMDIFSRLPFYDAVTDLEEQKKQVNIYVDYPLGPYGTASFASADEIIKIGLEKGRQLYPQIKRLKDSLDLIYGKQEMEPRAKRRDSILISEFEVKGLSDKKSESFKKLIGFKTDRYYTASQISDQIREAFATRGYSKLSYRLVPATQNGAKIIFYVEESVSTAFRFGLRYNTPIGIALKVGLVKRGFLSPYSVASATFAIGENPRGEAIYRYYLTKQRKLALQAETNFEVTDINTYNEDFRRTGLYRQASQNCDLQLYWQPDTHWLFGFGTTLSNVDYKPTIKSQVQASGNVAFLNTYLFLEHNTLNALIYPNKGRRVFVKAGIIYNQLPDFAIYQDDELIATEEDEIFGDDAYTQIKISLEQYIPINEHAIFARVQSGMNFNYKQILMNDFRIGGLNNVVRNQITFAGLSEASIFSSSVVSAQFGYQHAVTNNFYLTGIVNGLWYDFVKSNLTVNRDTNGVGYSLTAGYRTFLGPLEASMTYSDLNEKVLPYFNVGYVISLN